MSWIGEGISRAIDQLIMTVAVIGFTVGAVGVLFVVYVLPWAWHHIKPWLHLVTG